MNFARVRRILGQLLFVLALAQLVPLAWCFIDGDRDAALGFLAGAGSAGLAGGLLFLLGHAQGELYRREGVLIVVGAWLLASLAGAVPYLVSGAIPGPVDALFESASGFTTTGASVLVDVEAAGRPILFWRSLTQWLGGIGIVVLFVALLSELGPGARFLFNLEVPGPKAELMHARVRETALALFRIYLVLSLAQVVGMMAFGTGLYDALTHAFSTMSTGGFSPYADSVAHFGAPVQLVVLLFMLAGGINFSVYYALARRRQLGVLRDPELRLYALLVLGASALLTLDLSSWQPGHAGTHALEAAFQVVSLLTTTGFSTADFDTWPDLSRAVLVALMLAGGCAGSTAGGAKLVRVIIGWKAAMREVKLTFSPNAVVAIVLGRKLVPESSVQSVVSLLVLWLGAWGIGSLLLCVGGADLTTAATAAIATLSNVGPGLEAVGPAANFAFFASWQKLLMVGLMLLGRLEFFALLALLQARFWRR